MLILLSLLSYSAIAYDPSLVAKDMKLIQKKFMPITNPSIKANIAKIKREREDSPVKAVTIQDLEQLYFGQDSISNKMAAPKKKRSRTFK
ncbi:MAG: hypothetical protein HON90_12690 [Halobacteriovoraceae bacterium]|jgi:hypothetical protein|nr:hypothetical protein [Halobacteriovoraceae bacterium]